MTEQAQSQAAGAAAPTTANVLAPAAAPAAAPTSADAIMAQALVAGGHWTEAQATAALASVDAEPNEGEAPATGEALAEAAEPFNQYAAVADMKSTLTAVGIEGKDAGAAEYIVKRGLERAPTPEQNIREMHEVQQALDGLYGPEKAGWMIEWARREWQHLTAANPKLVDLAERSGAGNNLALIQQLAHRGINRYNRVRMGK